MSHPMKIEPDASVERCEERVAFWTETERAARAKADGKPGPLIALALVAERSRKQWAAALDVALAARARSRS